MSNDDLKKLSLPEVAALVVLMAEAREVSNNELEELAGFRLTGKERRTLNDLKLVESRKVGGQLAHQLSEHGWRTCRELFTADRPARSGSAGGALYVLLAGLHRSLGRLRLSPAEFFVSRADDPAPPEPVPDTDLESRIRVAYRSLVKEPGGWVSLADLRDRLGSSDRAEVDATLRRMDGSPRVHLIPVANLKALTTRDREAAIRMGGEENHALSIEGE
jgi:hypothetical protein